MTGVKLTYFNVTARGEPIRLLLHYGGVQFEDLRLQKSDFALIKESFPFGKLPVLEIDGIEIHQMIVICRYLGKKFGLAGKTEADALQCDMLAGSIDDLRGLLLRYYKETVPEAKENLRITNLPQADFFLKRFDDIIAKNGEHFVNGQLTWVDFMFAGQANNLSVFAGRDLYAELPHLRALIDKVHSLPQLKNYLQSRPETPF